MSQADAQRQRSLEKARQQLQEEMSSRREEITKKNTVTVGKVDDRFTAQHEDINAVLGRETVGLVTLTDFKSKQSALEAKAAAAAAVGATSLGKPEEKKKVARKLGPKPKSLSFALDEDEGDEGDSGADRSASDADNPAKRPKLLKNPNVDTSFLPDREREAQEQAERERLAREWREQQDKIKKESIEITYSYWDGTGHRAKIVCKKGDSVGQFLDKVRQQFHNLRGTSVDNLMYIKEDLIIPHHYTFYDFIVNKARGKSGPLFHFDVHEDVRLTADVTIERDESHPGKVVERRWYERNKHIFPASRWEVYDPNKDYGAYTIGDNSKTVPK